MPSKVIKKILVPLVFLPVLSGSCRKDEIEPVINPDQVEVTPIMARDTLYYLMRQWYYWAGRIPPVTKENYSDPYQLLEAMRYKPVDRWSFVADYDEYNAEMEGEFVGHGFRIGLDKDSKVRIAMIYKNAPLYSDGVRRGWIVKQINNVDPVPIFIQNDDEAYSSLIGPATAGITNTFLFERPDGTEVTISSAKKSFIINSVILYDTLHLRSGTIAGHLVFESFIKISENELKTAFAFFRANNVEDLILDLRYNTGGYLYIAQQLASYIAGNGKAGAVFTTLKYNNLNTASNVSYPFITTLYPVSLPRLVVLTSRSTASASEVVMNGLKPYINVVSTGDTTYGKPTGMDGWSCGDKYWFYPVTCETVNSSDEGGFYDGLPPDKTALDDIAYDFDNRNEESLKEAILYLETGAFSDKKHAGLINRPTFSEKPLRMNNTIIIR
jgi:carboxyl-terminal processing protease